MRKNLICKKHITWGGKVCYGYKFLIVKEEKETYLVCDNCGGRHDIEKVVE